jgi:hypothetical protein
MVTTDDIYWAKDRVIHLRKQLEEAEFKVRDLERRKREEDEAKRRDSAH